MVKQPQGAAATSGPKGARGRDSLPEGLQSSNCRRGPPRPPRNTAALSHSPPGREPHLPSHFPFTVLNGKPEGKGPGFDIIHQGQPVGKDEGREEIIVSSFPNRGRVERASFLLPHAPGRYFVFSCSNGCLVGPPRKYHE